MPTSTQCWPGTPAAHRSVRRMEGDQVVPGTLRRHKHVLDQGAQVAQRKALRCSLVLQQHEPASCGEPTRLRARRSIKPNAPAGCSSLGTGGSGSEAGAPAPGSRRRVGTRPSKQNSATETRPSASVVTSLSSSTAEPAGPAAPRARSGVGPGPAAAPPAEACGAAATSRATALATQRFRSRCAASRSSSPSVLTTGIAWPARLRTPRSHRSRGSAPRVVRARSLRKDSTLPALS